MLLPVVLLLTLAAPPATSGPEALERARRHLASGELEEVLLALEGRDFAASQRSAAAKLLGEAGRAALAKDDPVLALHLAQTALRLEPTQTLALEVAARTSLREHALGSAEDYARRLLALRPNNATAKLLAAEAEFGQARWRAALDLLGGVNTTALDKRDAMRVAELRDRAERELREREATAEAMSALTRRLKEAMADAGEFRQLVALREEVIVYSAPWCGVCKEVTAWLRRRGVRYVEKDVERDPDAANELAFKAAAAGLLPDGLPVVEIRGELLVGFDARRMEELLR